jgi:prepilin-type N-terminal cleavage/methylation domain-containing protein
MKPYPRTFNSPQFRGLSSTEFEDVSARALGFTAIELLVVIALVAIFCTMLLPALTRASGSSLTAQCLNNKRQLAIVCQMYSSENSDYLVPNAPQGQSGPSPIWCNADMAVNWTTAPGNTNRAAYRTNCVGPYVGDDLQLYKCPADTIPSDNGDRIRSVSMNCQMGSSHSGTIYNFNGSYKMYAKLSDLNCPFPSMAWIFCDESMYSLVDGLMQMNCGQPDYPDVPAAYHDGGNCFTFADGHAEVRLWKYPGGNASGILYVPYVKNVTGGHWPSSGLDPDWRWLRDRTACLP